MESWCLHHMALQIVPCVPLSYCSVGTDHTSDYQKCFEDVSLSVFFLYPIRLIFIFCNLNCLFFPFVFFFFNILINFLWKTTSPHSLRIHPESLVYNSQLLWRLILKSCHEQLSLTPPIYAWGPLFSCLVLKAPTLPKLPRWQTLVSPVQSQVLLNNAFLKGTSYIMKILK